MAAILYIYGPIKHYILYIDMSVHIGIVIMHIGIVIIYIIPISRTLDDICTIHECNVIRAGLTGQKVD